jgi:NADPH:quinone reductase-like Zn-dependent oxidoreductase
MQALVLEAAGEPLRLLQVSTPRPGPGQVLVRIAASGVNPLDVKIRDGNAGHARHPPPAILGIDLAGTVESVGLGVSRFKAGDEVFGMPGGVGGHQGSLAEYAAVDSDLLARKPANLSLREAAAVPLAFITAWEGLVDRADVQAGQMVLVQGGAGGVGQMVLCIAKARGARPFGVASASRRPMIERLDAQFVDKSEPVADYVERLTGGRGFDVVFDTAGGTALDASFAAVRRFGHVVSALGWGTHALAPLSFKAASYSGVFTLLPLLSGEGRAHHGEILDQAVKLAEAGQLQISLDPRRFSLDGVENAYTATKNGTMRGKLVVEIEPAHGS